MTEINLLPWREKKREQEKKQFAIYLLVGFISAIAVVFLVDYYAISLVDAQTKRNQRLKDEITKFERQIKDIKDIKKVRQALIARMIIVQNLQSTRTLTVRMFDEIIKVMPDGAYLNHLERVGDKVTVTGYAESNTNISQMMRNIEASNWIQEPELTEIKKSTDQKDLSEEKKEEKNQFKLSFILKPKKAMGIKYEHQSK